MISLRAIGKSLLKLEKVQGGLLTLSRLSNLPKASQSSEPSIYPSTFSLFYNLTYFRSKTSVKLRFLDLEEALETFRFVRLSFRAYQLTEKNMIPKIPARFQEKKLWIVAKTIRKTKA